MGLPPAAGTALRIETRRVVTGHDKNGRSCILHDAACGVRVSLGHPDLIVTDAWREAHLPADNGIFIDPCTEMELEPTRTGNVFRIVCFPPDREYIAALDTTAAFERLDENGLAASASSARHPLMHKTDTVDYVVIISGEIYVVMDEGEALLKPGDVLIQRGSNHAWSNRSTEMCVLAVVLNGASPRDGSPPDASASA